MTDKEIEVNSEYEIEIRANLLETIWQIKGKNMKVITIKQPWATLIAKGYKEYGFRT